MTKLQLYHQSFPAGSVIYYILKNWCFWTVVLEKTLESPLDYKEIQPVSPKGNQSWIFIERTGAETEAPVLWPPDVKTWLTGKDPDAGKDWGRREKGMTEDEMVGWYHQLSGHGFEQTAGAGDGQGGLVRCSPWGLRESHTLSDWTELIYYIKLCAGHWNGKKYRTWTCFTRAFVV